MTPEAQRIAISEACGWSEIWRSKHDGKLYGLEPQKVCAPEIPDYLNDLNAMHEAEKVLEGENRWNYGNTLALSVLSKERAYFGEDQDAEPNLNGFGHFALATVTAAQRAKMFLRTLGLWK